MYCKGCDNIIYFNNRSQEHKFCHNCYYFFELDLRSLYRYYYDNPDTTGGFIINGHLLYIHYNIGMEEYVFSIVKSNY